MCLSWCNCKLAQRQLPCCKPLYNCIVVYNSRKLYDILGSAVTRSARSRGNTRVARSWVGERAVKFTTATALRAKNGVGG